MSTLRQAQGPGAQGPGAQGPGAQGQGRCRARNRAAGVPSTSPNTACYAMRAYLQTLLVTGFGNPLLYLFGLGVGLARLVNVPVGGATYLEFVAPALLASAAVTVAGEEFSYPVLMGFKWNPIFFGMNAAPDLGPADRERHDLQRLRPDVPDGRGLLRVHAPLRRRAPLDAVCSTSSSRSLVGMSVGILIMAYTSTITEDHGQMAIIQRFILMPDVPVLRHVLSDHATCRSTCSGSAGSPRSGTGPSSAAC